MPHSTHRCLAGLCIVLIGVLCLSVQQLLAHSDPPPPIPIPPAKANIVTVKPLRWSWLHWWEANRERYLIPIAQAHLDQAVSDTAEQMLRKQMGEALLEGLDDPAFEVRRECALALGRMREQGAVEALSQRIPNDPHPEVRHRGITGLALIGEEDASGFLLSHPYANDYLRVAGLLGLGMAQPIPQTAQARLQTVLDGPPAYANAACEALIYPPCSLPLEQIKSRVADAPSPWICARLISALGQVGDSQTDRLLRQIAGHGPMLEKMAAWRFLDSVRADKSQAIEEMQASAKRGSVSQNAIENWNNAHNRLVQFDPTPPRPQQIVVLPPGLQFIEKKRIKNVRQGIEPLYQARLRAAAVLALGERQDPKAVPVLRQVLSDMQDDYNLVPRGYAAVALGQLGSKQSLADLIGLTMGRHGKRRSAVHIKDDDPLRGFAAIGLGLYLRPVVTAQGIQDRPGHKQAAQALIDRLNDQREQIEVRTACALALGLGQRTAHLPWLIKATQPLNPTSDVTLLGHLLLARGMLGDQNLTTSVQATLAARPHRDPTMNLLGRRAAVLSLGLTGSREVVPVLVQAWHQPFYVNREAIYAMSLNGAIGVGKDVIDELKNTKNRFGRAYMAKLLGELLISQRPSKLSHLSIARDVTLRDGLLEDHRMIANVFLYRYLIPQFKEPWY